MDTRCILPSVASVPQIGSYSFAAGLRHELSALNQSYAHRHGLVCRCSRGEPPVVCYLPCEKTKRHGNFLAQSYGAILKHPGWRRRLEKPHTSAREALPREGLRWRELDSSTSSDALLMNIFCYPRTLGERGILRLLDLAAGLSAEFGVKARVPLANGHFDRTEIDMRLGDLLVEAKLTESDFQHKSRQVVEGYRDFAEVFDSATLPSEDGCYLSYQLIRNVLAAYASGCSFCVMMDARRPDLKEAWFRIMASIQIHDLRLRSKMLTWQELAQTLPSKLQRFLLEKYGIGSSHGPSVMTEDGERGD